MADRGRRTHAHGRRRGARAPGRPPDGGRRRAGALGLRGRSLGAAAADARLREPHGLRRTGGRRGHGTRDASDAPAHQGRAPGRVALPRPRAGGLRLGPRDARRDDRGVARAVRGPAPAPRRRAVLGGVARTRPAPGRPRARPARELGRVPRLRRGHGPRAAGGQRDGADGAAHAALAGPAARPRAGRPGVAGAQRSGGASGGARDRRPAARRGPGPPGVAVDGGARGRAAALGRASRLATPVAPGPVRCMGPAYLRWRGDALPARAAAGAPPRATAAAVA